MQQLTMNVLRRYFRDVVHGAKKVEYRAMSPFWTRRLEPLKAPFRQRLLNGTLPPVPEAIVEVTRVVRNRARGQYELHLGRLIRVRNWNRKKGKPRT